MGTIHKRLATAANTSAGTGGIHPRSAGTRPATALIVATHKTEKTAKPRATIVRAARKAGRPQSLPRRNPTAVSVRKIPKVSCSNPADTGCSKTQPILCAGKDGSEGTHNDMV